MVPPLDVFTLQPQRNGGCQGKAHSMLAVCVDAGSVCDIRSTRKSVSAGSDRVGVASSTWSVWPHWPGASAVVMDSVVQTYSVCRRGRPRWLVVSVWERHSDTRSDGESAGGEESVWESFGERCVWENCAWENCVWENCVGELCVRECVCQGSPC
jgi:hypothetical protein